MTRMGGRGCAQISGFIHEAEGMDNGGQNLGPLRMDLHNNRQGELCAAEDGSCLTRCKNAYVMCKLQIIGGVEGCER